MACRFELHELLCAECRKPTGNLGTCEDEDLCAECRQGFIAIGVSDKDVADIVIGMAEILPLPMDEREDLIRKRQEKLLEQY